MILDVNAIALKTRRKSSVDALILDVHAKLALKSRRKNEQQAMKLSTRSGCPINQSSSNTVPTNSKRTQSSISKKETNAFTFSAKRKTSANLETFLFSLVPNKL